MTPEGQEEASKATTVERAGAGRPPTMVECLNVHKTYPSGPCVLQNVNVEIAKGECVVITGPGGAGKTTLVKLLLGTERPDSGTVLIEGRNVHTLPDRKLALLRQRTGVVFQDLKLMPRRTVYENVALPLFALARGEALVRQRVGQTLVALRLQEKADVPCEVLSESERRKTAIARAIVHGPVLLLADEPMAHLDEQDTALVVSLLEGLGMAGATVILTAHGRPRSLGRLAPRLLQIQARSLVEWRGA